MSEYYRLNTNKDHFPDGSDGTIVYQRGLAATFGGEDYENQIQKLDRGDTVFSYVDGQGYRAFGRVTEPYSGTPITNKENKLVKKDTNEYHISVDWKCVLSEDDAIYYRDANAILGLPESTPPNGSVRSLDVRDELAKRLQSHMRGTEDEEPTLWLGVSGSDPTNLNNSVGSNIDESIIRQHSDLEPDGDAYLWGAKGDVFENAEAGDWFLFSAEAKFPYAAKLVDVDPDADSLGDEIWEPKGNNDFDRIYLLEDRRKTNLTREEFQKIVDYSQYWSAMQNTSIQDEPLSLLRQKFGGVEEFIEAIEQKEPNKLYTDLAERLDNQKQIIFHGPPGTGKTHHAKQFADWWVTQNPETVQTNNQVRFVSFHPSFSYEDFIEGLTTTSKNGTVEYGIKDGVFKQFIEDMRSWDGSENWSADDFDQKPTYVLIIDEVNRGDVSQILGELVTLLEKDKRIDGDNEIQTTLAHSGEPFGIPENVYIIGTMNTADRSIALVDAALRRRFGFQHFPPDYEFLREHYEFNNKQELRNAYSDKGVTGLQALSIGALKEINDEIRNRRDLGRGKQIGHSYLMDCDTKRDIIRSWKYEVLPLIEEYFFEGYDDIRNTIFDGNNSADFLLDWDTQQIRSEFTDPNNQNKSEYTALREALENLVTSS